MEFLFTKKNQKNKFQNWAVNALYVMWPKSTKSSTLEWREYLYTFYHEEIVCDGLYSLII